MPVIGGRSLISTWWIVLPGCFLNRLNTICIFHRSSTTQWRVNSTSRFGSGQRSTARGLAHPDLQEGVVEYGGIVWKQERPTPQTLG